MKKLLINTSSQKLINKKIKCYYTNATSLNSEKILELQVKANLESYYVIFITKTWFNDISVPSLVNYTLFRRDREGIGGGVSIYIRKDLDSIEVPDEKLNLLIRGTISEQLWRCLKIENEALMVDCIYRLPPGQNQQ